MNSFKKTISVVLLACQMVFAFPAGATSTPDVQTPEASLLGSLIVLQGTQSAKATPDDRVKAAGRIYADYDHTAPKQDRSIRLQQALVDMKILTASQSAQFMNEVQATDAKLAPGKFANDMEVQNELTGLADNFSKGAQFAECHEGLLITGGVLIFGGFVSGMVGAFVRNDVELKEPYPADVTPSNIMLIGGTAAIAIGVIAVVLSTSGNACGNQ
jgi:hypothetical protein